MLADHIGAVWFPDAPVWRLIGRLAFPIYAYYVAVGMARTRNRRTYVIRLASLAAISQLPFMLLFNTWTVNVIGTFLVSVTAIYRMERTDDPRLKWLWPAGAAVLMETVPFDYGAYGLALILLYRYVQGELMWLGHLAMNAVYWSMGSTPLQVFSVFPTFLFAFMIGGAVRASGSGGSLPALSYSAPRWLWRAWYPAHLALLAVIAFATGVRS